jgi:hypothetical protein
VAIVCWCCVGRVLCMVRPWVGFGGRCWLLLVLRAVVAAWLWEDLILVVVGHLGLWDEECLQVAICPGSAC